MRPVFRVGGTYVIWRRNVRSARSEPNRDTPVATIQDTLGRYE